MGFNRKAKMKIKEEIVLYQKDNFFNYSYGRYLSNGILIIFSIICFIGIYLLFTNIKISLNILGLLLIILGSFAFIPSELMQIDFKERQYRKTIKIFNYLFPEEWKSLKRVKYLSIVRIKTSIYIKEGYNSNNSVESEDHLIETKLRFFIKSGYNITIDYYKKKTSAIYIGKLIANGLKLNLLDATKSPPEIIDT